MSLTLNADAATTPPERGLSASEASDILRRDGPNELPQEHKRGRFRIILDAVREPMLQLLLAAGIIYLVIGDLAEALILLAFAVLNVALVVVQEGRTERALTALKDMTSPGAFVIRDGTRLRITGSEVVAGDIIVLVEGDRVPADARLVEVTNLEADESLLTGESVPVRKAVSHGETEDARPGGDGSPHVWSGTLVVRGSGLARVTATGARTEIGRIGKSLGAVESAPTPLQIQTRRLVWIFATLGVGSSVLLAVVYGLLHGDWLAGILAGITLAMATLPEEFPLVLTVFLVLGAWRMSQSKVLTRRSAAIEALGAVTVLCTDKTGTLTLNWMTVAALVAGGERLAVATSGQPDLPEQFHRLVEFAILASRPDPLDPMERAFGELGERFLRHTEHLHTDWTLAHGYPLEPTLLAMSQVWRARNGAVFVVAAKGAPEAVADLCHLPMERIESIRRDVAALAAEGLRVLAVAEGTCPDTGWPESQHDFDFRFVGLLGLADPLRPEVRDAVAACTGGGIRIVMITGDHPATALAIARQAGIQADDALTGKDLAGLDDAGFRERLARTNVFARIMPEQKLRLVQGFAAAGEVVAMTGDGVNDAPSLKAAHIGVAMGGRGTDVAREAASLVLLDDNFASLVTAVRLGRRIDDNLRKAIGYILAVHVPIAGMSLLPVLLGWPLVLGPIHVVFLELIIDPVSSIVFEAEPEEAGIMSRPPRKPDAPLFDTALLLHGLLQGAVVMVAALGIFLLGIRDDHSEEVARCMAFVTLVLGNLGLVLTNRSMTSSAVRVLMRPNRALLFVTVTTVLALSLSVSVPWLRGLFGFAPLTLPHLAEAAGAALACVVVNDAIGMVWRGLAAWIWTRQPTRGTTALAAASGGGQSPIPVPHRSLRPITQPVMLAGGLGALALLVGGGYWMLAPEDGGQAVLVRLRSDSAMLGPTTAPPEASQGTQVVPPSADKIGKLPIAPEPSPARAVTPSADHPRTPSPAPPSAVAAGEPASPAPIQAPAPTAAAASPERAPSPTAPPATTSATGKVTVQVATVFSEAKATYEWHRLQARLPDMLGSREPIVIRTKRGGRAFWLVRTGGFADTAQAAGFCQRVHAKGFHCDVIVHGRPTEAGEPIVAQGARRTPD